MTMYYEDINQLAKNPKAAITLAGLLNPATAAPTIIIGIIGLTALIGVKAYRNLKDENQRLEGDKQALKNELEAVIDEYEDEDNEPLDNGYATVEPTVQIMSDEELKKEMIRQAMSELGKRSAAKRAEKNN